MDDNNLIDSEIQEIKLGGGWKIIISLEMSAKYNNHYVTISKERSGKLKTKININPKHIKTLGEQLIIFSKNYKLDS